jgi:hypothetical protein
LSGVQRTFSRRFATALLAALATLDLVAAARAGAQQTVTVSGIVRDSVSARPLPGAVVTLEILTGARTTRTDETGAFAFSKVPVGSYKLIVRRLGFEPASQTIDANADTPPIVVAMNRVATLDTVRVHASAQGIYGVVGTARDLRPLPAAKLKIIGGSSVPVDSTGHFFQPINAAGTVIIRAEAEGYEPQVMSLVVRPNEGVEVALLLDSATTPASHMLAGAFADFGTRLMVRRNSSAIIPRSELLRDSDRQLVSAMRRAPSFNRAALRFGQFACVFVDGQPRPGVSIDAFDPAEIEAVETYTRTSEASGSLAKRWPRGFPCADTGVPQVSAGADVVYWVVIWLKQ